MEKFKSFITEEEKLQSYRFVVIYNDPENMSDDSVAEAEELAINFVKSGNELGLKGFRCRIEDAYLSYKNEKMYIHDMNDKEFLIDENTRIRIQLESYKSKVVNQNIDTNSILSKYYFVSARVINNSFSKTIRSRNLTNTK